MIGIMVGIMSLYIFFAKWVPIATLAVVFIKKF